jgi:hypothetical protein
MVDLPTPPLPDATATTGAEGSAPRPGARSAGGASGRALPLGSGTSVGGVARLARSARARSRDAWSATGASARWEVGRLTRPPPSNGSNSPPSSLPSAEPRGRPEGPGSVRAAPGHRTILRIRARPVEDEPRQPLGAGRLEVVGHLLPRGDRAERQTGESPSMSQQHAQRRPPRRAWSTSERVGPERAEPLGDRAQHGVLEIAETTRCVRARSRRRRGRPELDRAAPRRAGCAPACRSAPRRTR